MVIDTSAIAAIIFDEPERGILSDIVTREPVIAMSAASLYETSIVVAGRFHDRSAFRIVDDFIADFSIEIVACDMEQSIAARDAYMTYGRGWHAAALNFADCFSYVVAKTRNEPLLFKGGDFRKTDIVPAWTP
jgi:ribonuclease VapC